MKAGNLPALLSLLLMTAAIAAAQEGAKEEREPHWREDFRDDFDSFDPANWQDQILWVNDEDQCYVRDGRHGTLVDAGQCRDSTGCQFRSLGRPPGASH